MSRWILFLSMLVATWSLLGCDTKDRIAGPVHGEVVLSCLGMEDLGPDYVYQGWLSSGDDLVSVGTFTVDGAGALTPDRFEVSEEHIWVAERFIITIEPVPDDDPAPSKTRYMAGDFSVIGAISGDAWLTCGHADALGDDFSKLYGNYLLETPTTAGDPDDYAYGIWFGIPGAPPHWGTLISLRYLPDGWLYEGWIITPDSSISTGKFSAVSSPDSDGPGPSAGPDPGADYPGQDFIDPPLYLRGHGVWITIEPDPDNSSEPFTLVVLADSVIADLGPFSFQALENKVESSFPTGVAAR
ncbi:anti-sigma factor [Candidatus Zixiibacteriota bacterium]